MTTAVATLYLRVITNRCSDSNLADTSSTHKAMSSLSSEHTLIFLTFVTMSHDDDASWKNFLQNPTSPEGFQRLNSQPTAPQERTPAGRATHWPLPPALNPKQPIPFPSPLRRLPQSNPLNEPPSPPPGRWVTRDELQQAIRNVRNEHKTAVEDIRTQ